jgi:hypothetical protein
MDIVYSLTVHESPECVLDLIKNIIFFNKDLKICIVIHTNNVMYEELKDLKLTNIFINPSHFDKKLANVTIFKAHIENFLFSKQLDIYFKYFIPIASNCYFHKELKLEYIETLLKKFEPAIKGTDYNNGWDWWPSIFKNKKIIEILNQEKCVDLFISEHEGQVHTYDSISYISDTIIKYNIFENVEMPDTVFEEFMFSTLYARFTGKKVVNICKMFWDLPLFRPNVQHIEDSDKPMVKRVLRNFYDDVRIHFRNKTNNYLNM